MVHKLQQLETPSETGIKLSGKNALLKTNTFIMTDYVLWHIIWHSQYFKKFVQNVCFDFQGECYASLTCIVRHTYLCF
jgi:hypothetical protein